MFLSLLYAEKGQKAMSKRWRTQYDGQERRITNCGNPVVKTYVLGDDGNLVENGFTNIYDEIQSHRESVELSTLLQRYMNGDETALNQQVGIFVDTTDYPKNYAEMFDRVNQAVDSFGELPPELRNLFNNNPVEFWSSLGSAEFMEKVAKYSAASVKNSGVNSSQPDNSGAGASSTSDVGGTSNE